MIGRSRSSIAVVMAALALACVAAPVAADETPPTRQDTASVSPLPSISSSAPLAIADSVVTISDLSFRFDVTVTQSAHAIEHTRLRLVTARFTTNGAPRIDMRPSRRLQHIVHDRRPQHIAQNRSG